MRSGSTELALDFILFLRGSNEKSLSSVLSSSSSLLKICRSGVTFRFRACLTSLSGGSSRERLLDFEFGTALVFEADFFWPGFFVAIGARDVAVDADGLGEGLATCFAGTETEIFLTTVFGFVVPNISVMATGAEIIGDAIGKMVNKKCANVFE